MKYISLLSTLALTLCHRAHAQHGVPAQEVEVRSKEVKIAMADKLFKLEDSAALSICRSALDNAVQNATLLQEKIERMVEEFNAELDALERDLKKKAKQGQSLNHQSREMRRKLIEAEDELQYMHQQAISTYVNVTLMRENVVNSAKKRIIGAITFHRRRWAPRFQRSKQRYYAKLRRLNPYITKLKKELSSFAKLGEKRWTRSTLLRPMVQRTTKAVSKQFLARAGPYIKIAKEATYLSAVSAVEEISSAGISYLNKLAEKQKEKARRDYERQLDNRRRVTASGSARMKKARAKVDDEDFEFTPSHLQREVKRVLEYSLRQPKRIADRGCELSPLILTLIATKGFLLGLVLLYFGIPTSMIWFLCLVNLFRLVRRSHRVE